MQDSWKSGDPYEYFMGRWSRLVAQLFVEWLSPESGLKWLDVGCGSGALSEVIILGFEPAELIALDQSEGFINAVRDRLGDKAQYKVGNALDLPLVNDSINACVSGLVLNFIPNPLKSLAEMRRVTTVGGHVAVYVWDYAGTMGFLTHFWNAADKLNPAVAKLHERHRFPDSNADGLKSLFEKTGFVGIDIVPIDIETTFQNFDDYWKPFLGGQGPAGTYVQSLEESDRERLRVALNESLPVQDDGAIYMRARAWAAKGRVPLE